MIIYKNQKRIVKWKFNNPFFLCKNEIKYRKTSGNLRLDLEIFGNEYFQIFPFRGKKAVNMLKSI